MATTPRVTDPAGWGYSLANLGEILFACLDAIPARTVAEVGAYRGELTRELLDWAAGSGARVTAIDPDPPDELLDLERRRPELELLRETSHEALRRISLPDALIIDGDHNYYTLSEELRLIAEGAAGSLLPLLMFHDVGWPHARRDTYSAPDRIPEEHRQPLAHDVALAPWEPGVAEAGLSFEWAAEREGGPRNGLLTALEDFVAGRDELRLAVVPAFFGLGVLWQRDAPWADSVAAITGPLDRHPVLERLEANRVGHLAARYGLVRDVEQAQETIARQAEQLGEQEKLLQEMLGSRAFALAEGVSRLRQGGEPIFSRERVRRVLREPDAG
jgi:methyltransferase family protein